MNVVVGIGYAVSSIQRRYRIDLQPRYYSSIFLFVRLLTFCLFWFVLYSLVLSISDKLIDQMIILSNYWAHWWIDEFIWIWLKFCGANFSNKRFLEFFGEIYLLENLLIGIRRPDYVACPVYRQFWSIENSFVLKSWKALQM